MALKECLILLHKYAALFSIISTYQQTISGAVNSFIIVGIEF